MKIYKTLPDGVQIVEYEDSLAPAVADMWNRSGEGWGGSFSGSVWTAEQVIAKRASGAFFNVFIAIKDGEAIGYCSFNRYDKDEDTAYVHLLNVRPDYHSKKVGKALVLMCVNETIARGMPRLDIHTWPGNTKSVPLYKKCGFFWEDRTDTTHLCNFIPTVLSTGLFRDFFGNADWYGDSTRKVEIRPDGVKTDKFEFFEYSWEKDGELLRVGFEKTGRRIRFVETNDYKLEMSAVNHELAFGLSYRCGFRVENKSGKELSVEIRAKSDGAIVFEDFWSETVSRSADFEGSFFVKTITEEQDPRRMHPCILADIYINGRHVEFGLGIEPKFPVTAELVAKRQVAKPGMTEDAYINIKNNLPRDAAVRFKIPENRLSRFGQSEFIADLTCGRGLMIAAQATVTDCGYACLPVTYEITMTDGELITFTRPLHLVNQGLSGQFAFETDSHHGAANGLWRLLLDKKSNNAKYVRIVPSGYGEFRISKLGTPYSDEFNLMKPADVRVVQNGAAITFEADFVSKAFAGAVLTEIYDFDAAGTLKCRHRVANRGENALELSVETEFWTNVGKRTVFHYDGDFHELTDDLNYGFDNIVQEKLDENWIFDARGENPSGICWPLQYAFSSNWGDVLKFEIPTGEIAPGQCFETEPIIYMCGVFKNYREFRNYVRGVHDEAIPLARNHLELITNGGNPVLSTNALPLTVRNNRLKILEGSVCVSSPDGLFAAETMDTPPDELRTETVFPITVSPGISGVGFVDFSLNYAAFKKDVRRAILITDKTKIKSTDRSGVLSVTNGDLSFSVAPETSDAAYSLTFRDKEWFFSTYPSLEPYSWWNPFVGGLKSFLERMNNSLVLRENISASFTTETDTMGNKWTGIRADVSVVNFDEYKGVRYSQFYLTLPGVPVLCHFMRLENGTGAYLNADMYSTLFLSGKEGLSDLSVALTATDKTRYDLPLGRESMDMDFDRLAVFSCGGDSPRQEKLCVFKDSARDRGKQLVGFDINIAYCEFNMKGCAPDCGFITTKPLFCILTDKDLTLESLSDLERIEFRS